MAAAGAGRTLTYTAFNKPNTITANGATTSFTYDADFQRVKKSVNVAGAVTNGCTSSLLPLTRRVFIISPFVWIRLDVRGITTIG